MAVDREILVRRQRILADFGELALRSNKLQELLDESCRLVADALDTDLAKILEVHPDGKTALVRAGIGWAPGIVGTLRLEMDVHSSETYALSQARPIVTQDITTEIRFHFPRFLREHGVVAILNAPIFLPGGRAFGLLQVDAREARDFDDEDIAFLRTYCMVLSSAIHRLQTALELGHSDERFRLIVEHAHDHAIILTDPEDRITGWFAGAAAIFGWTEQEVTGQSMSIIYTPEDRANDIPRLETERAAQHGSAPNIRWHMGKGGRRVFLDGQRIALRKDDGTLRGFFKIAQDTTERRRAEERQSVLHAELQHRVRNVLAMIAAVVRRSDARGTAEDLRSALAGRIAAMARTQALLMHCGERGGRSRNDNPG